MTTVKTIKNIIFRVNGNAEIGFGHIYRCLALAQMLEESYNVQFVLSANSSAEIINKKYNTHLLRPIPISQEPDLLASKFSSDEYILILDGYDFDKDYCTTLKQHGFRTLYIDDFGRFDYPVNHLINHAIGLEQPTNLDQKNAILHLGSNFALLRPEFLIEYPTEEKKNVLISFGGSDVFNLSTPAINACLEADIFDKIHVIQGKEIKPAVLDLADKNNSVVIHQSIDASDMVRIMKTCKLAISSASNFLYELCSLRIPTLAGYYVDNQTKLYNGVLNNNLILGLGNIKEFKQADFLKHMQVAKDSDLDELTRQQEIFFDHRSKNRIKDIVEQLSINLWLKPASESDIDLVFEWANDPLVRENSYYSDEISYEVHTKWFYGKLASKSTKMLLMMVEDRAAGFVRFESEEDHATIGILINNDFRGQRLASPILKQACEYFHTQSNLPIWAYIKKTNIASHKSFIRANFKYLRDDEVNKKPSVVLSFNK